MCTLVSQIICLMYHYWHLVVQILRNIVSKTYIEAKCHALIEDMQTADILIAQFRLHAEQSNFI